MAVEDDAVEREGAVVPGEARLERGRLLGPERGVADRLRVDVVELGERRDPERGADGGAGLHPRAEADPRRELRREARPEALVPVGAEAGTDSAGGRGGRDERPGELDEGGAPGAGVPSEVRRVDRVAPRLAPDREGAAEERAARHEADGGAVGVVEVPVEGGVRPLEDEVVPVVAHGDRGGEGPAATEGEVGREAKAPAPGLLVLVRVTRAVEAPGAEGPARRPPRG